MTPGELRDASRREHELYEELVAIYGALEGLLTDEQAAPDRLVDATRAASRVASALAAVDRTLAPARVAQGVPADVAALWRTSAQVAARAAAKNRLLVAKASARRDRVAHRRHALGERRRATTGYVPAPGRRIGLDARA